MTALSRSEHFTMKQVLARRVFAFAAASNAYGLVAEFGRRFNAAMHSRESGGRDCLVPLNVFMKAVSDPPPIDEAAMSGAHDFVMSMNKGQPRSVQALNVIAFRDGTLNAGGGVGWRDASNDPQP